MPFPIYAIESVTRSVDDVNLVRISHYIVISRQIAIVSSTDVKSDRIVATVVLAPTHTHSPYRCSGDEMPFVSRESALTLTICCWDDQSMPPFSGNRRRQFGGCFALDGKRPINGYIRMPSSPSSSSSLLNNTQSM